MASFLNPAPVMPAKGGVFNTQARLGADSDFMTLEDLANVQHMNHMLSEGPEILKAAAHNLAVTESQIIRGMGGFGGEVDAHSMLSVDRTQGRIGDKKKPQDGVFMAPLLKEGKYDATAANKLAMMPHTRTSRAGGEDPTELLPQELGVMANPAGFAKFGAAVDTHNVYSRVGESTRGSYHQ